MKKRVIAVFAAALILCSLFAGSGCRNDNAAGAAEKGILLKHIDDLENDEMEKIAAVFTTNLGVFKIKFFASDAPNTVRSFIKLTREGFYDGLNFHRVVPGYMVVGGCPNGDGTGGPGYTVALEENDRHNTRGAVGLIHPPFMPDNGGSQFYILLQDDLRIDGSYTVFGKVISGMEVLDRIGEMPNTGERGKPSPYMPLKPVIINTVRLEII